MYKKTIYYCVLDSKPKKGVESIVTNNNQSLDFGKLRRLRYKKMLCNIRKSINHELENNNSPRLIRK